MLQAGALDRLIPDSEAEHGYMFASSPWSKAYDPTAASAASHPVHYRNCDAARAAARRRSDTVTPGYAPHLDRDGDEVGCEPYYGR